MFSPSHEDAARLDDIVGQLDALPIGGGVAVDLLELLAFGLALRGQELALLLAHRFTHHALAGDHFDDRLKIDLPGLEDGLDSQGLAEISKKIARKERVLGIFRAQFLDPGQSHLLLPRCQGVALIAEVNDEPLIRRGLGHDDAFVDELMQQFFVPCL